MKQTRSAISNTTNQATFSTVVAEQYSEDNKPKSIRTPKVQQEEASKPVDPYQVIGNASVLMRRIADRVMRIADAVDYPRAELIDIMTGKAPLTKAVMYCSPEIHDLIDMYLEVRELRAKIMGEHNVGSFG